VTKTDEYREALYPLKYLYNAVLFKVLILDWPSALAIISCW